MNRRCALAVVIGAMAMVVVAIGAVRQFAPFEFMEGLPWRNAVASDGFVPPGSTGFLVTGSWPKIAKAAEQELLDAGFEYERGGCGFSQIRAFSRSSLDAT